MLQRSGVDADTLAVATESVSQILRSGAFNSTSEQTDALRGIVQSMQIALAVDAVADADATVVSSGDHSLTVSAQRLDAHSFEHGASVDFAGVVNTSLRLPSAAALGVNPNASVIAHTYATNPFTSCARPDACDAIVSSVVSAELRDGGGAIPVANASEPIVVVVAKDSALGRRLRSANGERRCVWWDERERSWSKWH